MQYLPSIGKIGLALLAATLASGLARAQPAPAPLPREAAPVLSSTAERIYAATWPSLLQIRTLVAAAGPQSTIGSGFLVSAGGLAITNYHVVSQYALEPDSYALEYATVDGRRGKLELMAIDVADDLAVVRMDQSGGSFLGFDERVLTGRLPNGERLYAMGNPLDLGFTIVEGTYNGLVERSYNERIHFTGAMNPGMSGGPSVTVEGRIVGINVAKQVGSELVSFLVPGRFAAALLDRVKDVAPSPKELRAEIGRQLTRWQAGLYQSFADKGFRAATFGPYRAPESTAPWFSCWARTNTGQVPKPRASVSATQCSSDTRLFIANDLYTGGIGLAHSYLRSIDLNQFQFSAFLSQQNQLSWFGWSRKWHTHQRCHEDFLAPDATGERPPLRAVWCARAYREFAGLYDVSVLVATQDRGDETLISRLSLQGIAYDNAMALARRFIEAIQWQK